eukprot:5266402-Pyramimonas_sp.AAC.2
MVSSAIKADHALCNPVCELSTTGPPVLDPPLRRSGAGPEGGGPHRTVLNAAESNVTCWVLWGVECTLAVIGTGGP